MRFESKRDLWLLFILRVMPLVLLLVIADVWYLQHHDMRGPIAGAFILIVFELFFFESVLRSTYYVIDAGTLVIRSSVFAWRVPIAEIRSITPTRSALSSPALSLDRLRIEYGGKSILVSPEDRQRFIEALRAKNPSIVA
jgi:hypothetical protein